MMSRHFSPAAALPLPKDWTEHVRSALIHAVSLAAAALGHHPQPSGCEPKPTTALAGRTRPR
jgi:hypothetical protein